MVDPSLRRLLDDDEAVTLRDGRLSLNAGLVWVDTWALEQAVADSRLEEALVLYRGPFLPDEAEQPSYIACREQSRARLLRLLMRAAREQEEAGRPEAAVDFYMRLIDSDPLFEAAYRNVMLLLQRRREPAEARAV